MPLSPIPVILCPSVSLLIVLFLSLASFAYPPVSSLGFTRQFWFSLVLCENAFVCAFCFGFFF